MRLMERLLALGPNHETILRTSDLIAMIKDNITRLKQDKKSGTSQVGTPQLAIQVKPTLKNRLKELQVFDDCCIFCEPMRARKTVIDLVLGENRSAQKRPHNHCCNHDFMVDEVKRHWKSAGLQKAIEMGFLGRPFDNQAELDRWWKDPVNLKWGPGYEVNNAFVVFLAVAIPERETDGGLDMSSERRKMWV